MVGKGLKHYTLWLWNLNCTGTVVIFWTQSEPCIKTYCFSSYTMLQISSIQHFLIGVNYCTWEYTIIKFVHHGIVSRFFLWKKRKYSMWFSNTINLQHILIGSVCIIEHLKQKNRPTKDDGAWFELANKIVLSLPIICDDRGQCHRSYKNSKFNATHEREVVFSEEFWGLASWIEMSAGCGQSRPTRTLGTRQQKCSNVITVASPP